MTRRLRTIAIILGVLIVIIVVLPFLIPVNQFRPTIEAKASTALGRKVTVGNLSFSLLSGSLSAADLSVGDDSRFSQSPFLTAKSLKVGVEIMPLIFSRKLNVTGVTIDNPRVTLLRNAGGEWNFSSLGASAGKPAPKQTAEGSSSGSLADVSVKKLELKDGEIVVGSTSSPKRSTYDHVNVTVSDFSMTSVFPLSVTADLPRGGRFALDGKAGPIDPADASFTPVDGTLKISSLDLASTGFLDPAAGLGGLVDLDAKLRSRNGQAETNGTAKLSKALLVAGGSPASEPATVDFNTSYDLRKGAGVLNPSTLKMGNAAAHLNGTYQTAGEATVLNAHIEGQNMPAKDLAAFLPALGINLPKGASLPAGALNTNLNVTGPTNKLVTSGNVGLFGANLAGFDLGSRMSSIASLAGIKTGKDLQIEKLTSNLRIAPDGLRAENFLAVVPALGTLMGGGTIDAKNNLDFKMAAVMASSVGAAGSPAAGAAGLLGKLTAGGGCKGGTTVPFLIQGTASEPKFVPDVGGLAAGMLKSQLGCLSGTSGPKNEQAPQNVIKGLKGLFKKK